MKVYSAIVLAIFVTSPIFAQEDQKFNGTCPENITAQANFNQTAYEGNWYEIKRFVNTLISGECGNPTYKKDSTGFKVTYLSTNLADKNTTSVDIALKKIAAQPDGYYSVNVNNKTEAIPHIILKTDYKTHSVVWGCAYNSDNKTNTQRLSIYSRNKKLDSATIKDIQTFVKEKNISISEANFKNVEQDDKKCGRNSGAALLVPSVLSGVIAVLLTRKF